MASIMTSFDIFLSYNHNNKKVVEKINSKLKEIGYTVWIDFEQIMTGDSLVDKMTEGIVLSKILIVFITEDYCRSKNCKNEIKFAAKRNKKIFYVVLQDLRKEQYKNDMDIAQIEFLMSDNLIFNAYKTPRTFEPWNDQLFIQLIDCIKTYHPDFAKIDNQRVSNFKNNTSYTNENSKIDNNQKVSSSRENSSYDAQEKASKQDDIQKFPLSKTKFNNFTISNEFKCIHQINAHSNYVLSLVMINSITLASGSIDNSIKIWNTTDANCIKHITNAHDNFVLSLVRINENTFASGSSDDSIKIWDANNFSCRCNIREAHGGSVNCLVVINNNAFATGSFDKSIKIWDASNFTCIRSINDAHDDSVECLLMINNNTFASGSEDYSIKIWDTTNFTCRYHITNAHDYAVNCLVMINNNVFATGSYDKSIKIWDSKNCTCIKHITNAHNYVVNCLIMINNNTFASGSYDKSIKIWDSTNFTCIKHITNAHDNAVYCLVMINNNTFASGSENSIKIWQSPTN